MSVMLRKRYPIFGFKSVIHQKKSEITCFEDVIISKMAACDDYHSIVHILTIVIIFWSRQCTHTLHGFICVPETILSYIGMMAHWIPPIFMLLSIMQSWCNADDVAVSCGYDTCIAVRTCDELYHFIFSLVVRLYSEIGHIHLGIEA